jgi:hypothetical protein
MAMQIYIVQSQGRSHKKSGGEVQANCFGARRVQLRHVDLRRNFYELCLAFGAAKEIVACSSAMSW